MSPSPRSIVAEAHGHWNAWFEDQSFETFGGDTPGTAVERLWEAELNNRVAVSRRLLDTIQADLTRLTHWVVFERDLEDTSSRVRSEVAEYLQTLFAEGKVQGDRPEDAYFVRCDRTTMVSAEIEVDQLAIVVGIALHKPAEFEVLRIIHSTAGSG